MNFMKYKNLRRKGNLLGEKRIVTRNIDVYTYDELSDKAKERVKEQMEKSRCDDSDIFDDDCGTILKELFPNSNLKFQYSLSYSQGDGFNTYGTLDIDDLINVDLTEYPLNKSRIKPLENKNKIKKVCDKADISCIKLEENHRYCYSLADRINLSDVDTDELSDTDNELLDKLQDFASEVMEFINSKLEENGYKWFYDFDEDDVIEWVNVNDYEFTEDGEIVFNIKESYIKESRELFKDYEKIRDLEESWSVDKKNQLLQDYIECLNDRDFDIELRNNILYVNGEEVLNVGGYAVQFKIYLISKELYERGYFD